MWRNIPSEHADTTTQNFTQLEAIAVGFFIFTVNLWSYIIWLYNFIFYHENVHSCIRINITNKIYRYFDGIYFNYCFINTTFKKMLLFVNCTENHFYPKKWWSETSIISIQIFRGKICKAKLFVWNDSLIG